MKCGSGIKKSYKHGNFLTVACDGSVVEINVFKGYTLACSSYETDSVFIVFGHGNTLNGMCFAFFARDYNGSIHFESFPFIFGKVIILSKGYSNFIVTNFFKVSESINKVYIIFIGKFIEALEPCRGTFTYYHISEFTLDPLICNYNCVLTGCRSIKLAVNNTLNRKKGIIETECRFGAVCICNFNLKILYLYHLVQFVRSCRSFYEFDGFNIACAKITSCKYA